MQFPPLLFGISILFLLSGSANAALLTPSTFGTLVDINRDGFETVANVDVSADILLDTTGNQFFPLNQVREERAVLEFSLNGLSGATINNAILQLAFSGASGSGGIRPIVDIYGFFGDGVISLTDATETGRLLATGLNSPFFPPFSVQSFIQDAAFAGATHAGFLMVNTHDGTNHGFDSKNFGISSNLNLDFVVSVPEPSAISLLLTGLLGLTLRYRRTNIRR